MGELQPRHAHQFLGLIPEDVTQLPVHLEPCLVPRRSGHADHRAFEIAAEVLLAGAQVALGVAQRRHVDHGDHDSIVRGLVAGDDRPADDDVERLPGEGAAGAFDFDAGTAFGDGGDLLGEPGQRPLDEAVAQGGQQVVLAGRSEEVHCTLVHLKDADEVGDAPQLVRVRQKVRVHVACALRAQLVHSLLDGGEILYPDGDRQRLEQSAVIFPSKMVAVAKRRLGHTTPSRACG